MNKRMLLFILLLISCVQKKSFYDIDGPELEFYGYYKDKILFQYNEPVKTMTVKSDKDQLSVNNDFYTANIYIESVLFKKSKNSTLNITAEDSSGNISSFSMKAPRINDNPALLIIEEINLKYSKNTKQYLKIRSVKEGRTDGACLILFIRGQKNTIFFKEEYAPAGSLMLITVESDEDEKKQNQTLTFSEKENTLFFKNRLSLISSCIIICDYKNDIADYFLYYNLKNHDKNYYENNKNFNRCRFELTGRNINPVCHDISGITTKNPVKRINNKFTMDK